MRGLGVTGIGRVRLLIHRLHLTLYRLADGLQGGENAHESKRTRASNFLTVHQNCEFAIVAVNDLDSDPEISPQSCRRPGGLDSRDSVAAATDGNAHAGSGPDA
jgi:hypothetical protein